MKPMTSSSLTAALSIRSRLDRNTAGRENISIGGDWEFLRPNRPMASSQIFFEGRDNSPGKVGGSFVARNDSRGELHVAVVLGKHPDRWPPRPTRNGVRGARQPRFLAMIERET